MSEAKRLPPIYNADGTISICLTRGYWTVINDVDADLINSVWRVYAGKKQTPYAGLQSYVYAPMHRIIMARVLGRQLEKYELVDHRDGDSLNNRRDNLRFATLAQNAQNHKKPNGWSSPYKGVTWHKKAQKWQAFIRCDGKAYYLGLFENPLDAHKAYCEKAVELHGEYARFV